LNLNRHALISISLFATLGIQLFSPAIAEVPAGRSGKLKLSTRVGDNWRDYIYFAEPTDRNKDELLDFRKTTDKTEQPWPEDQKRLISQCLDEIFSQCPDLIRQAASGYRLALIRLITLKSERKSESPCKSYHGAEAGKGAIIFGSQSLDDYNAQGRLKAVVVHELVHRADNIRNVAFSKEWRVLTKYILPRVRLRSQFLTSNGTRFYDRTLSENAIWPSLYGSTNPNEALAEYMAWSVNNDSMLFKKNDWLDAVRNRLLHPTEKILLTKERARARRQARPLWDNRKFAPPNGFFDKRKNCPDLRLLYQEAEYKRRHKNILLAKRFPIDYCIKHWAELDDIGFQRTCMLYAADLDMHQKYSESLGWLELFLFWKPEDVTAVKMHSLVSRHLNNYGSSLDYEYRLAGYTGLDCCAIIDLKADPDFVNKVIAYIQSGKFTEREKLNLMGQLMLQESENCGTEKEKKTFLEKALAYYEDSLEIDDKYKLETVLKCFNISLKLGRIQKARTYYEQADKINHSAIPTLIAEIKLLDYDGKHQEAKSKSDLISVLIKNADLPYRSFPEFSFEILDVSDIKVIDSHFLKLNVAQVSKPLTKDNLLIEVPAHPFTIDTNFNRHKPVLLPVGEPKIGL